MRSRVLGFGILLRCRWYMPFNDNHENLKEVERSIGGVNHYFERDFEKRLYHNEGSRWRIRSDMLEDVNKKLKKDEMGKTYFI